MSDKIKIELTEEEHEFVTSILMMHHIGLILEVKNRKLLSRIAKDFSLRDIKNKALKNR